MKKLNYELLNELMLFSKKILRLLYVLVIAVMIFLGIRAVKETQLLGFAWKFICIIMPLFIGFAIAWILNPIVDQIETKGCNRCIASVIVFVSFLGILGTILVLIIPILYNQIIDLTENLPKILDSLSETITNVDFYAFVEQFNRELPQMFINLVKGAISCIGVFGVSLVISLYLIMDYHCIIVWVKNLFPKNEYSILLTKINKEVRRCVNGTLLVATIVFVLDTLLFIIVKLPSPVLLGLFCGLTDLIPYIGPYIGGIAAVIVAFSESKLLGIITVIIVVAVQCLENMILQPIVMSKATKLHPVTIIMGLMIFGELFGIVGMIIATPIVALLKVIVRFIQVKYEK